MDATHPSSFSPALPRLPDEFARVCVCLCGTPFALSHHVPTVCLLTLTEIHLLAVGALHLRLLTQCQGALPVSNPPAQWQAARGAPAAPSLSQADRSCTSLSLCPLSSGVCRPRVAVARCCVAEHHAQRAQGFRVKVVPARAAASSRGGPTSAPGAAAGGPVGAPWLH